ncbi:MAG: hypothetical protein M1835_003980 [Candelina submexicana]|nr:MAG: hypothetical protein M1835_003980 [Candelina submexicana]
MKDQSIEQWKPEIIKACKEEPTPCSYLWIGQTLKRIRKREIAVSKIRTPAMTRILLTSVQMAKAPESNAQAAGETSAIPLHFQETFVSNPAGEHRKDDHARVPDHNPMEASSTEVVRVGMFPFEKLPTELRLMIYDLFLEPGSIAECPEGPPSSYRRLRIGSLCSLGSVSRSFDNEIGPLLDKRIYNSAETCFVFQDHHDLEGFLSGFVTVDAIGTITSIRRKTFHRVVIHLVSLPKRATCSLVLPNEAPSAVPGRANKTRYHRLQQKKEKSGANMLNWKSQLRTLLSHHTIKKLRLVVHDGFRSAFKPESPLVQMLLRNKFHVEEVLIEGHTSNDNSIVDKVKKHMEQQATPSSLHEERLEGNTVV